jgi:hypothetical protein
MTTVPQKDDLIQNDEEKEIKIQELREIIANAQETISSATQLLSAIQGVKPSEFSAEMPINPADDAEEDGQAFYGYFDGQIMVGDDGKQYPVPANYASKSKLVEGDKLKLNITPDNRFVYKQIGPVQRNYLIGLVKKDDKGNYSVQTPDREYKVLLAAATYFKIEPGDEVTLIVPQGKTTVWGAIENVLQKNVGIPELDMDMASEASINSEVSPSNKTTSSNSSNNSPEYTKDDLLTVDASDNSSQELPSELDLTDESTANENNNSTNNSELSAIEKLELELEKERASMTENKTPVNDDATGTNEWAADIEKLKQEAGVATE